MAQAAWSRLRDLQSQFRLADLFDILLVALFVYLVITWFRTSASRRMVVGVLVVGAVYFLARTFDMYLTSLLLRTGLTVGLVALVVIFQEDLRRAFEWIASWRSRRGPARSDGGSGFSEVLVEGLTLLASLNRGALVVIEGHGEVDRHLSAGTPLDGKISVPLLCSIFDPHSPGHDGAIVVDGKRIRQFGVHLPLSTNEPHIEGLGTRHAAAVGLSERCDALVVVVSEERGVISVAERGMLAHLESPAGLRQRLTDFFASRFPHRVGPSWKRRLWRDWHTKTLAVTLAAIAWLALAFRTETIQRTFNVPIEYRSLAADWQLPEPRPREVRVTLAGSERAFNLLDPTQLRVSLELAGIRPGAQRFTLTEENLNSPSDLAVQDFEPQSLSLEAYPVITRQLPVEIRKRGRLPDGLQLESLTAAPASIAVTLSTTDRGRVDSVATRPVDLSRIHETQTVRAPLDLPGDADYITSGINEVEVTIRVAQAAAP